ncbi:hemolysin D [Fluviicoccus keumensis]|uniref:Membrane fusion protein (MFP) family protein n=1 Tax=Fluviicoccus keumensis TaxID=1435465 RepID=A0A4Q7ZA32_9GAMM|nr:HlyD family type I secretion periplasmic adaptor subunit [Fluviicoccus keumensis]RZU46745.1 hemolysin D [Fluviicoccus keumensis]
MSLKIRLQAWADLWRHYGDVFRHAWANREATDGRKLQPHEAQFLPAALALQETPVSPAPRLAMWLIMSFAILALAWSYFGWIDIVAVAQGKIVPSDRTKVIQSFEPSSVKAIHVHDGMHVKAGQVLIELDGTSVEADRMRIRNELGSARLDAALARAMIEAVDDDRKPVMSRPAGTSETDWLESLQQLEGHFREYRSKMSLLDADILQKQASLRSTQEVVRKLEKSLPIVQQRAQNFRKLSEADNVPQDLFLQREQARLDMEGDLASNRSKLKEIEASLVAAREQKTALMAETRRAHLDSLDEATRKISGLEQELVKADSRNSLMKLTAPVDGTVQQLAVHTVGGVVTEAQALMAVVPDEDALEVEAMVDNQDIGFIREGQNAEIKIQTFSYTKYGLIHGTVTSVSSDAINDDKKGLIYSARVRMAKRSMNIDGRTVNLTPGMAVTVEVKTGQRRLIEFFLNPLLQVRHDSLRER